MSIQEAPGRGGLPCRLAWRTCVFVVTKFKRRSLNSRRKQVEQTVYETGSSV